MFRNYMKMAIRHLFRHKLSSVVNILCLSIGLTFSMIIGVYILQQYRVNADIKNVNNQYYIQSHWKIAGMGEEFTTLGPLAKTMKEEYPTLVANYYRFNPVTNVLSAGDRHFKEDVAICDTTLISMYGFPLLYGDKERAFPNPSSALITETLAMKLFGRKDVVGQVMQMQTLSKIPQDYTVSGVLKDLPYNTVTGSFTSGNISFGAYVPIEGNHYYPGGDGSNSWTGWSEVSLLELKKGVSPDQLIRPSINVLQKNTTKDIQTNLKIDLAPLNNYYIQNNNGAIGRMIFSLSLVAFFILVMAIINFVNINIGNSSYRLKEIGLRKVFGGERAQLITQFMMESFLLTMLAALISAGMYELLRPAFDHLLQLELDPIWQFKWQAILLFLLLVSTVGLASGLYPAFFLSASDIITSVKGKLDSGRGGLRLRKTLLVIQFTMAIVVFISAVTVYRQVSYVFKKDLGFDKDRLVVITPFPKQWDSTGVARMEAIKQGLMQLPAVKDGSLSFDLTETPPGTQPLIPEGLNGRQPLLIPGITTDDHFASTFGLHLVEGTFFNEGRGAYIPNQIVLNQSAVKAFGWTTAVGRKVRTTGGGPDLTVAGVVKDFNYANLQSSITPLSISNIRDNPAYRFLTIKLNSPDMAGSIEALKAQWKKLTPNSPFEYVFLDERFKNIYRLELQLKGAAGIATMLNLVIVFMGIFGVVAFTLVKRSKEMAVRKVLGANVWNIITLFIRDYAGLVLIANIIGWPIAYFLTGKWLQSFAYKIPQDIGPYLFVLVFVFLTVSLLVAGQCLRMALDSPVKRLKAE